MAQDDAPVGAAGRPRGFDEDVLAVGKHQTPRHPRVDHPAGDGEHEDDIEDTAADHVEDEQGQQQRREPHLDVDQAHDRVVDMPAIEPGQETQDRADSARK